MKQSRLQCFLKGLLTENPTLVLVLGTCPTIAKSNTLFNALGLGVCTAIVLILSNVVISALRRVIPDKVRIPCYILIIAGFVTMIQMSVHAFLPTLYESLGAFIALIVVNCIILGRAEMFASKNGVLDSLLDGAGMGVGFILSLSAMALIRELFGAGQLFGYDVPFFAAYHFPILQKTFGGFLVFGIMIAVVSAVTGGKAPRRRSFDCASCPNAAVCSGAAICGESDTADKTDKEEGAQT
ncbi:MAG: electron transport complex subunit RsxE [Clostridia bacterium]|nr:electron transport complex subunit RsxE [Clostridia bacterium]